MVMKRTVLSRAFIIAAALGLIAILAGCAGGALDFNVWGADYSGTGELDNHKTGDLAITCDSNGIVTGTLTVAGADGPDVEFKFTAGVYNLVGSITSTGGNFEVSGNVPTMGDFFIRGNFPTDGSAKDYKGVTVANTTFPTPQSYDGSLTRDP